MFTGLDCIIQDQATEANMSTFQNYFMQDHMLNFDLMETEAMPDLESECRVPEFDIDEELARLRRDASRIERLNQIDEEPQQLIKRAPITDIGEIVSLDGEIYTNEDKLNEEVMSNSTAESSEHQKQKLSIIDVAIRMSEENVLRISDFTGEFDIFEKVFISNLLLIKKGKSVDWDMPSDQFVKESNKLLSLNRERRKDDRLRFIYKRAIKFLLAKCTEYQSNKSFRMEDFAEQFIKHYFGKKNNINQDVLDTSYASCKKLKLYFTHSQNFKRDFIEQALDQILSEYTAYTADQYYKMFCLLKSQIDQSKPSDKILFSRFKRIPWSASDILMSAHLIKELAH